MPHATADILRQASARADALLESLASEQLDVGPLAGAAVTEGLAQGRAAGCDVLDAVRKLAADLRLLASTDSRHRTDRK
jgi:hypothetical protein